MKKALFTLIAVASGFGSSLGQDSDTRDVSKNLQKALKGSSEMISKVTVASCVADISVFRIERESNSYHPSQPPQGMAGFPTSDYGFGNSSYDSFVKYKVTNYKIDLAKADAASVEASEFAVRGRRFASLSLKTDADAIAVKAGNRSTSTDQFRIGISHKTATKVTDAFKAAIGACSAVR